MFRPMRPETIARRAIEHAADRERSHADLVARLADAAAGATGEYLDRASFYADLLADHRAGCDRCPCLWCDRIGSHSPACERATAAEARLREIARLPGEPMA